MLDLIKKCLKNFICDVIKSYEKNNRWKNQFKSAVTYVKIG